MKNQIIEGLEKDGYVIIKDVLTKDTVETINKELERIIKEYKIEKCVTPFEGRNTIRVYNPLNKSDIFNNLVLEDSILAAAEHFLGEDLLVSSVTPIIRYPGEVDQDLHTDDAFFGFERPHRMLAINVLYALTDFTKENGGTWVVPGSHNNPDHPTQEDIKQSITAEVKSGGVVIYNASTWHGGGANHSNLPRAFCSVYYSLGCLRQEENLVLSIDEKRMKSFPQRLKQLCGYSAYKGLVGHVDRMDPIVLLGEKPLTKMIWDVDITEASFGATSERQKRTTSGFVA
jgi:ectoine hydroxylase-related dioxygenase (phytanoyl-CoA dioxygenase family)